LVKRGIQSDATTVQNEHANELTGSHTFLGLSIHGGNDVQPPPPTLITASSRLGRPKPTLRLKDVEVSPWPSTSSLDHYKGTQLAGGNKANRVEVVGVISMESMDDGWPGGHT
jgi:hypothetical protein